MAKNKAVETVEVKEEVKAEEIRPLTIDDIKAEIEVTTQKGVALQKYINSESFKKEKLAIRRLKMEQFNTYCALIDCLQAQLSVM